MKFTLIYKPEERELLLFKHCIWVTMGRKEAPKKPPSSKLLRNVLHARHSPVRVLNFAFLIEDIPSNIATHLARHVHAVPFVSSLRNDRQERMDGDNAPRNTPVDMIFYCNAEELMTFANKRLCGRAAKRTQQVARMMCDEAEKAMPELSGDLVPMCIYHGGVCHELESCGRCVCG
nr:MAG TPA: Thymidylate synthase complementing protein [Caudoviricetes sp.]